MPISTSQHGETQRCTILVLHKLSWMVCRMYTVMSKTCQNTHLKTKQTENQTCFVFIFSDVSCSVMWNSALCFVACTTHTRVIGCEVGSAIGFLPRFSLGMFFFGLMLLSITDRTGRPLRWSYLNPKLASANGQWLLQTFKKWSVLTPNIDTFCFKRLTGPEAPKMELS